MKYMQATQHCFFVEKVFSKRHLKNSMHIFPTKTIKNIPMRNCEHYANNLCIFSDFFSEFHKFSLNITGGTLMNLFGQEKTLKLKPYTGDSIIDDGTQECLQ